MNSPSPRARRPVDPLKAQWEASDFDAFSLGIEQGRLPRASTMRSIFAPKALRMALDRTDSSKRTPRERRQAMDGLHKALLQACEALPAALDGRRDILAQMRINGSFTLLSSELVHRQCAMGAGAAGAFDELFDKAFAAVLSMTTPRVFHDVDVGTSWVQTDKGRAVLDVCRSRQRRPALWPKALGLPLRSAMALVEQAELAAKRPIDPAAAWRALRSFRLRGAHPESFAFLASKAAPADAASFQALATDVALGAYQYPRRSAREWLGALRALCRVASGIPGALDAAALVGSRPLTLAEAQSAGAQRPFALISPEPFARAEERARFGGPSAADERKRAVDMLDWLDGCAQIAADFSLADLPRALSNTRLEKAYATLGRFHGDIPHAFPALAPSLPEAFNSRKMAIELGGLPAQAAPKRSPSL